MMGVKIKTDTRTNELIFIGWWIDGCYCMLDSEAFLNETNRTFFKEKIRV